VKTGMGVRMHDCGCGAIQIFCNHVGRAEPLEEVAKPAGNLVL
jgi:hypothetical protein